MIHIVTDSCCDLTPELLQRYSIHVVPLYVTIGETSYRDGVDIHLDELFKSVKQTGKLPSTSAPATADYIRTFESLEGEIIFSGIGSRLSASFQNATMAAEHVTGRNYYLVDSRNLSSGTSHLLVRAAEMRDQGCSADEIAAEMKRSVPLIRTAFIMDTLNYLYMGGRCSALENVMGSLLKIHPIIEAKSDGTLGVKEKVRGSRASSLKRLLAILEQDLPNVNLKRLFITHSGCDEDAAWLRQQILNRAPFEEVIPTYTGATVASHCGPNTLSIIYLLNK